MCPSWTQTKEQKSKAGGDKKSEEYKKSVQSNLTEAKNNHAENETNTKLVTEKYRPIYEKQAKEKQSEYHGNQYDTKRGLTVKLPQVQNKKERNPTTDKKLSDIAGVSTDTYSKGKRTYYKGMSKYVEGCRIIGR